mgnify:CR=1 FL=1
MRLKLDPETAAFCRLFEDCSGVFAKDCFFDGQGTVYFVVAPDDMGKALGKQGSTVKRFQQAVSRSVRVVPFAEDAVTFVKNVIAPLQVAEIVETENSLILKDTQKKTKSLLIGRDGKRLQLINRAVQRFFPGKEVKVV